MKTIALFLILCFAPMAGFIYAGDNAAEVNEKISLRNYVIKGTVVDQNNESVAGAMVVINNQKVYTDLDGNFVIENIQNDKCEVNVSMISYEPQTFIVSASKSKNLTIKL